jgi:hypothetical protein
MEIIPAEKGGIMDETAESLWEEMNDVDRASKETYKDNFFSDYEEFGRDVAIYNLGFLVGWEDGNTAIKDD